MLDPSRPVDRGTRKEVLALYGRATTVDPHCYQAWHQWGLSNYRAVEEARFLQQGGSGVQGLGPGGQGGQGVGMGQGGQGGGIGGQHTQHTHHTHGLHTPHAVTPLVVNALKGLMRALTLGTRRVSSSVSQDMLCILSVWFRYCKLPEVRAVLSSGLAMVHINTWLGVLPQLIARIDHPDTPTRSLLHDLLIRLGAKHAEAVVYPLFVAIKSPRGRRKEAAEELMSSLRQHSAKMIDQALLVSQELMRVAILWEENWHLSLEEAARLFFGDGNIQGMLDMLVPLHQTLE
ncbi:hypothetical protein B484DRAFT_388959, partial [Ochromonadaceae sp. CCMP2298]